MRSDGMPNEKGCARCRTRATVPCAANKTLGSEVLQDAAKWVWHVAFCNAGQCAALRRSVLRGEVTVALERPRLLALPPRLREAVEGMAAAEESRVGSKRRGCCASGVGVSVGVAVSASQISTSDRTQRANRTRNTSSASAQVLRNSSSSLQTPWSPQRSALGSLLPTLNPVQLCSRWPRTAAHSHDIAE
jgi:hypothetical protein